MLILLLAFSPITLFSLYQVFDLKASMERGKTIYEAQCLSCHMAEGEGLEGVFPPVAKWPIFKRLTKTMWEPLELVRIVSHVLSHSLSVSQKVLIPMKLSSALHCRNFEKTGIDKLEFFLLNI